MSSLESWISVIGSIASIGGAIWAFIEANKASKSASKAEKVKGELVERRKLVEVSQVHAETSRILKTVSTVGPSCNSRSSEALIVQTLLKRLKSIVVILTSKALTFPTSLIIKRKNYVRQFVQTLSCCQKLRLLTKKKALEKPFTISSMALCP